VELRVAKDILGKCADELVEYEFLLKNNMTSFSNYRYFSPFWASAERFQVMNRTVTGFSNISTIEGLPNLKVPFDEIDDPLKRVSAIRNTSNAKLFREWLEKTAGQSPDTEMVKAYLEAISERKGVLDTTSGKLMKSVALPAVGMGVGAAATVYAGAAVGAAAAAASVAAAEKMAEFGAETALGLLDSFVLERVARGWSPRMFFDDLSKLRQLPKKKM
jgi:hypothetical protein